VSFREAAFLNRLAAHSLAGLGEPRFAVVILNWLRWRADARLFSMLSTIPSACDLPTLCASVIFATSSDVFTWLPQECPSSREVLIVPSGNY
jgi:hypothetical protein